jgi:hypothetical protein
MTLLLIFLVAIAILSVCMGVLFSWAWSAVFVARDAPEPPDQPCDLDDPEKRSEFERRHPQSRH